MESFWRIVSGWEPFGQGLFFLLVLGGAATLIQKVIYYIIVGVRGWPPAHCNTEESEDEDG